MPNDRRYDDSVATFLANTTPPVRNFQCPAGLIAFVPQVEPSSKAITLLAQMETLCIATIKAGSPLQNPNLTFEAMQAIREREAVKANTKLDTIEADVTA